MMLIAALKQKNALHEFFLTIKTATFLRTVMEFLIVRNLTRFLVRISQQAR